MYQLSGTNSAVPPCWYPRHVDLDTWQQLQFPSPGFGSSAHTIEPSESPGHRALDIAMAVGANGALAGKKPAPTAAAEGAAASGLRNRRPVAAARSGQNTGRGMGGSTAGILRFYTDDSPGLKIGPTTVLVSCLMFVGFVVLLHVWGKFRG